MHQYCDGLTYEDCETAYFNAVGFYIETAFGAIECTDPLHSDARSVMFVRREREADEAVALLTDEEAMLVYESRGVFLKASERAKKAGDDNRAHAYSIFYDLWLQTLMF